ncbi:MAG: RAMP superfamily CRISPR-associated protein [Planctomycetaceae bacterium]|jgi:CRISPR/Cas system CSM-associated protein Csm3 (group 7 of RAMP superfamily)|nr:RAMP superfamily CRISPR-associated protein [Planctomycetaceae bacterium]
MTIKMRYNYTLTLKSDAEPGTGVGGHIINQRVPRNRNGEPIIPATHLKGLIREELLKLGELFPNELDTLADECCGKADEDGKGDWTTESCFYISDAVLKNENKNETGTKTSFVSRTSIDSASGKAKETSLRTTERIAVDNVFKGMLTVNAKEGSQQDLAIRLAMLSIGAIGGNRTRGGGKCLIEFDSRQNSKPGDLFKQLLKSKKDELPQKENVNFLRTETTTLRLIFEADSPVCCPEHPVPSNVIKSGFAIPASAVQGLILNRLNQRNEDAATKLFNDENFRAYPLLPCAAFKQDKKENYPIPLRVSLTHKVAKLISEGDTLISNGDKLNVADEAIAKYDWKKVEGANPLKATGGVLLINGNERELWQAKSIPHIPSAHGVLNDKNTTDGRNLYQVDSIAPIVWSGFVRLPKWAADVVFGNCNDNNLQEIFVSFGKKRSTHGNGKLFAFPVDEEDKTLPYNSSTHGSKNMETVLIVQSPILLPDKSSDQPANEEFKIFVETKWGIQPKECMGTVIGIQFGWNRHGKGKQTGKGKRVRACRCVMPGSVIIFETNIENLSNKIKSGLGGGREQGFGAVAVHPGLATKIFSPDKSDSKLLKSDVDEKTMIQEVLKIWNNHQKDLPSPSQLAAVRKELEINGKDKTQEYLDHQTKRTERIWATWESCFSEVENFIKNTDSKLAAKGLKLLIDLKISEKN